MTTYSVAVRRPAALPTSYGRGLSAVVFAPITALFGMAFETRVGVTSAAVVAWFGVMAMLASRLQHSRPR